MNGGRGQVGVIANQAVGIVAPMPGSVVRLMGPGPTWLRWMYFPLHFELVVDGAVVSDVWPGETAMSEVAPGTHMVRLQRPHARFLRSSGLEVTAERGKSVELECTGPLSYLMTSVPDLCVASPNESE